MQALQTALRLFEGARVLSHSPAAAGCLSLSRSISQLPGSQPYANQQQQPCVGAPAEQQCAQNGMQQLSQQQQQQQPLHGARPFHTFSSSSRPAQQLWQQQQQGLSTQSDGAGGSNLSRQVVGMEARQQLDELLQVLLHPMPRAARWNSQLSPYLLQVNDQLLLQPSAVLQSVVRALHVLRGVLQENGQVYVVENHQRLRPLIKTAALSCINPNVWFEHRTWSPGTLTNYASAKRLFKESHQPNRRLFAAKGYRMVNPLLPRVDGKVGPLPPLQDPVPRLSYDDKWLLYRRTRRPGYRLLLQTLLESEDALHRFKPAGSLKGAPQDLSLMIFLDSTKNAVAIKEAYNKNIPTIAIVNSAADMAHVTYPVLARDFSPGFAHFFLDWIVKVANTPLPQDGPSEQQPEQRSSADRRSPADQQRRR